MTSLVMGQNKHTTHTQKQKTTPEEYKSLCSILTILLLSHSLHLHFTFYLSTHFSLSVSLTLSPVLKPQQLVPFVSVQLTCPYILERRNCGLRESIDKALIIELGWHFSEY